MQMETYFTNVNKISKCFILRKWIFLSIFILIFQGCEPLEAITDTYGDIVDEFTEDDNNDESEVGQVLVSPNFPSATQAFFDVTVLTKAGTLVKDDTAVKCFFNNTDFPEFSFDFDVLTTSGVTSCGTNNTEGTIPFNFTFVAVVEGVSSDTTAITLPAGATA
jgi:hypothetical protein